MSGATFPSKSGGVNLNDYKTNGMILEFGPIATSLQSEFDQDGTNPVLQKNNIAFFVATIINFQEQYCGINATNPPFTRYPFEIFRDYKIHGHLHRLLRIMISYLAKQQWFQTKLHIDSQQGNGNSHLLLDLSDTSLLQRHFEAFRYIQQQLTQQQIIRQKVIYFSPLVQDQARLAQIARNHGADISDNHTNLVTHVILPNNQDMMDSGEEHVRTIEKQEKLAYIHYWFYPSSYDQWISSDLIDGDAENLDPPEGAWRVGERFLTDLQKYNEWMVELDYEILDDASPQPNQQHNTTNNANAFQSHPQQHDQMMNQQMQHMQQMQPQQMNQHQMQQQQYHQQQMMMQQQQMQHHQQQQYHHQQQQHPVVVTSNGTSAHIANTNAMQHQRQQGYMNNNNYPMNNLVNAALNPNAAQQAIKSQRAQPTTSNNSRKRKRGNNGVVIDDEMDDPEGEWVPPTKKQKVGQGAIIDLANDDIDDNEVAQDAKALKGINANNSNKGRGRKKNTNKGYVTVDDLNNSQSKQKLKFKLKRRKNPTTHIVANKEAIQREIEAKKKNMDPSLNGGDMFPYSGPSLTRIRPMIASYPIVVPSYSRWFRLDRIHPIEYQSVSSLFKNKAMQYHERYMQVRNFIVNSYRVNPRIYLTVTSCRRIIAADAGAVYRIHKFLEEWGLINYQVDDGSIPEFEPPMIDYTHVDTPFGVKIALKPGMDQTSIDKNAAKIMRENAQRRKDLGKKVFGQRENMFSMADGQYNTDKRECELLAQVDNNYSCSYCGIDCSQARYRCNIQKDMILCSKCFDAKRYSQVFDDNDFDMELQKIKKSAPEDPENKENDMDVDVMQNESDKKPFNIKPWSDDELKKLKQALNQHHDDWTKVSEFVGRDQNECIAQFIQLPINDAFLDSIEDKRDPDINKIYHPQISQYLASSISSTSTTKDNDNFEHKLSFLNPNPNKIPSPFADAGHPILGQVASMSAIVNTQIVNVASNAALTFINNQKIISPSQLSKGKMVDTKMGRGVIQEIINHQQSNNNHNKNININTDNISTKALQYEIKFEFGSATLKYDDIIDIVHNDDQEQKSNDNDQLSSWHKYPQNVSQQKAKAAGVLGTTAAIAKALKNHKDTHIEQLLQHLVLLQSQKVKFSKNHISFVIYPNFQFQPYSLLIVMRMSHRAKLAHLEELWFVLQREREEVQDMKHELFRERIEIAKLKLQYQPDENDEDEQEEDIKDIKVQK